MSKKERDFKQSFGQEKARVKLYKSGKHWVKAGIREFQLLKMLGLPFLNKEIDDIKDIHNTNSNNLKKQALRTTGLVGGAFTFAMLNDHHAFAASETPMTSEISSNSATVANQNSTAISKSEVSDSSSATSQESSTNSTETTQSASGTNKDSQTKDETNSNASETSSTSTSENGDSNTATSTSENGDSNTATSTSENGDSNTVTSTSEK